MAVSSGGLAANGRGSFLERFFGMKRSGSTLGTELIAGLTTFMVMSYIIFVNPGVLTASGDKGLTFPAVMAATCLVAGAMTILMGLLCNYPFALAPGMGLNAVVAFQLIASQGLPWQAAMGVIFLEGVVITVLVLTGFRQAIMNAIPVSLKQSIGVGIGLFLLLIGLVDARIVQMGSPGGPPVALGDLTSWPIFVAFVGILLTMWLMARRIKAALLLGIIGSTVLAIIINYATGQSAYPQGAADLTRGVAIIPSSVVATPDFANFSQGFNFDVFARLGIVTAILTIFSIMLSDFFDTMGTVIGISREAGWLDKAGKLPRLGRVLFVDSLAAVFGGFSGSSSATTYIESAAGVSEGGRTGLASVLTGMLFLLAMFLSPIAQIVPAEATAPALIVVGFLMATIVKDIPFGNFEEGFPALLTIAVMPFTYSITNGIGIGFISYVFLKLVLGKGRQVHWMLYLAAAAFVLYFVYPWLKLQFGL